VHQAHLPDRLRAVVLPTLPGDTENAKFAGVFCSAPSWLLYFCMACLDRFILGIELPKNSDPRPDLGQDGLHDMRSWPDLPTGTMGAGRLMPRSHALDALSSEELIDLIRIIQSGEENWTRRDRHRHREIMAKVDREELSRALMRLSSTSCGSGSESQKKP
jgi:hypothetical protein